VHVHIPISDLIKIQEWWRTAFITPIPGAP
jgi:hypothetical protein